MESFEEELRNLLLAEHSKKQTHFIADRIGKNKGKFSVLMKLFFANEIIITQRCSMVVGYLLEKHPSLLTPPM